MIKLKDIEYSDASVINVEAIIENFAVLAAEIEASRTRINVIPAGFGTMCCPIMFRGLYEVIPKDHPGLNIRSAYCILGDNVKSTTKASLYINDKKVAAIKFAENERSGKLQEFILPEDVDMGKFDTLSVRISDDRRMTFTVSFANEEVNNG